MTNSADRIGLERQLRIPSSRALPGQRTATVEGDDDTDILDMKGAAESRRAFFQRSSTGRVSRAPWADMKESIYARRPNYRRSRARVALF